MSSRILIFAALCLLYLNYSQAQTQDDLDALDQKISHHVQTKMTGWTHKRVEPIKGSKGVLVETWSFPNKGVKVAVSTLKSAEEARRSLEGFVKDTKEAELLKGYGDEAYIWGYGGSDLVVRRGRYIVYINAGANVEADPDIRTLSHAERQARQNSEMRRLTKEFARHLINALDLP